MEKTISAGVLLLANVFLFAYESNSFGAELDHNNVVIVLDASGSMNNKLRRTKEKKMDAAKSALGAVLQQIPQDTHIGLLVFGAANVKNDWVYPLGPRNNSQLLSAINGITPRGGTPLGRYIKKGADRLLQQRTAQHGYGTYRLLVVTDGQAGDPAYVDKFAPDIVSRGITLDVIGVDMKTRHTLATKAHSYRSADDQATLQKAISEVFAEVGGADSANTGEDAFAEIAPLPVDTAAAMLKSLSTSGNHPIGDNPNSAATHSAMPTTPNPQPAPYTPPHSHSYESTKNTSQVFIWAFVMGIILLVAFLGAVKKR